MLPQGGRARVALADVVAEAWDGCSDLEASGSSSTGSSGDSSSSSGSSSGSESEEDEEAGCRVGLGGPGGSGGAVLCWCWQAAWEAGVRVRPTPSLHTATAARTAVTRARTLLAAGGVGGCGGCWLRPFAAAQQEEEAVRGAGP